MPNASDRQAENYFRAALENKQFICTAELVLGRDHSASEAEVFVREAAAQRDGMRVILRARRLSLSLRAQQSIRSKCASPT